MIKWEDQSRKGKVYASRAEFGWLYIIVHNYIGHPDDVWFVSSPSGQTKPLESSDIEAAKVEAVEIVGEKLREALHALTATGE